MTDAASAITPATVHGRERVLFLDGWRGVAIFSVFVGHFAILPGINIGKMGVELFFVLSGRLMAEILFVEKYPLPEFFLRRISRIWPALFFFVLASGVVFGASGLLRVDLLHIVAALTFTINYFSESQARLPLYDHIWSLCIEEWSYVLLGILAVFARRLSFDVKALLAGLALACAANGVVQTLLGGDYYSVYWRTDVRAASILAGAAAYLYLRSKTPPAWTPIVLGALGVLLSINHVPDMVKYTAGTLCFALSVVTLPVAPRFALQILGHPIVVRIGLWSFSLYLWQQPFYKLIGSFPTWALLAMATVCGVASFYFVEQPARRWLNQLRRPRSVAPSAA
ncbi:putative acyltransferase [Caulobacter sp. AP07]|uniref:acyltransferase family protein n=1 Tax=Caulobacter sp. AP07 TaxID=1144304 RepID=UPI000271EDA5|nr:acyltransferase [Caulobacter sp. AP07]EJL34058.1 putative acyltransferase [Caulobacter sp. AP07]